MTPQVRRRPLLAALTWTTSVPVLTLVVLALTWGRYLPAVLSVLIAVVLFGALLAAVHYA